MFRARLGKVNLPLFHQPGWRNGRRTALKMRRGRPREGSNPSPGTKDPCRTGESGNPRDYAGFPFPQSVESTSVRGVFASLVTILEPRIPAETLFPTRELGC